MSGSTDSSLTTQTVTLGSGGYTSPLTISVVGTVAPPHGGVTGIYIPSSASNALLNKGQIFGGTGDAGTAGAPGYATGGSFGQGAPGAVGGDGSAGGTGIYLAGLGSVTNHATIEGGAGGAGGAGGNGVSGGGLGAQGGNGGNGGTGGTGINLTDGGSVTNTGTIIGGSGGAGGAGGTTVGYDLAGSAGAGGTGVVVGANAVLTNTQLIIGGAGGTAGVGVYLDGGTLITSGTIIGGTEADGLGDAVRFGSLSSVLVVDAGANFSGTVLANNGAGDTLELSGISHTALDGIGTEFQNFAAIDFASGASWSIAGTSAAFDSGQTIAGFTVIDQIDVTDFAATSDTFISGTGLVLSNGTKTETLGFTGTLARGHFVIASDGANGTDITEVTCFAQGTRIATTQGEVPVEALTIGMEVLTVDAGPQPVKWIGTRSYAAPFANHPKVLPVLIRADALAAGVPSRDLIVSPGHAISLEGHLIHAQRLVNGVTIKQLRKVERITYFHIELERHHVLLAENCLAESFRGEVFRGQFANAASFTARYPGQIAPEAPCQPVLQQGFKLQDILDGLDRRAGIAPLTPRLGPLRGVVERQEAGVIIGWAQDIAAPEQPVELHLFEGERLFARLLANFYRADLQSQLGGSGAWGFEVELPPGITGTVSVRRATDAALLPPRDALRALTA